MISNITIHLLWKCLQNGQLGFLLWASILYVLWLLHFWSECLILIAPQHKQDYKWLSVRYRIILYLEHHVSDNTLYKQSWLNMQQRIYWLLSQLVRLNHIFFKSMNKQIEWRKYSQLVHVTPPVSRHRASWERLSGHRSYFGIHAETLSGITCLLRRNKNIKRVS